MICPRCLHNFVEREAEVLATDADTRHQLLWTRVACPVCGACQDRLEAYPILMAAR